MTFAVDIPDMHAALAALIAQVPPGRVTTYGRLAEALGSDSATRWVGGAVLEPSFAARAPVHRIVRAGGELGVYVAGDVDEKRRRLQDEGVEVTDDRVDLSRSLFEDFQSPRPLDDLRALQTTLATKLRLTRPRRAPRTVGGVDLSYIGDDAAVAGFALIDAASLKLLWSTTLTVSVDFPYIPTFLAFRELPPLLKLLEQVRREDRLPDLVFVDGNGVLHDRRMGIASMLGIAADLPTVGVSKKLLCGRVDLKDMQHRETRPVVDGDEVLGMALKSRATSKPIFVSPGHRVDFDTATKVVQQLLAGHRLPEPTHWADKLSRAVVRERAAG